MAMVCAHRVWVQPASPRALRLRAHDHVRHGLHLLHLLQKPDAALRRHHHVGPVEHRDEHCGKLHHMVVRVGKRQIVEDELKGQEHFHIKRGRTGQTNVQERGASAVCLLHHITIAHLAHERPLRLAFVPQRIARLSQALVHTPREHLVEGQCSDRARAWRRCTSRFLGRSGLLGGGCAGLVVFGAGCTGHV